MDRSPSPTVMAARLALTYAVAGTAWVLFSDVVLARLGLPMEVERFVASTKGAGFVLVTSVVLFLMGRAGLTRVRQAQAAVREQDARIRQAYVDVFGAVTGGKLVLVTDAEMGRALGAPLTEPIRLTTPEGLADARRVIREAAADHVPEAKVAGAVSAAGEALNNSLKHAGSGSYQVFYGNGRLQVEVADKGPGIDFRTLPSATLIPGFSTAQTLGMGFTIMLQLCERVLICTEPGSTAVVLEL